MGALEGDASPKEAQRQRDISVISMGKTVGAPQGDASPKVEGREKPACRREHGQQCTDTNSVFG